MAMVLEIYKSRGKLVQILSLKDLRKIPFSVCMCGKFYRALPDTFFGGVDGLSMCSCCRINIYKEMEIR